MSSLTGISGHPPNPGGSLPASQVLGRDALVEAYWDTLERQSVALFSARRVGKTSILKRMEDRVPGGWQVRLRDLEGLDSAPAFAQLVYEGLGVDVLKQQIPSAGSELIPTIQDLRDDDYVRVKDRTVRFALDFVRRFWREDRMV